MAGRGHWLVALAWAVAGGTWAVQAGAQSNRIFAFDIPAEPLDTALSSLSQATGLQLLSDSTLIAGRRGNTVVGRMTSQEALTRLLTGTGLRARFTAGGSIVITAVAVADMTLDALHVQAAPMLGTGTDDRATAYVQLVQRDIVAAIQADPDLATGAYRIRLRVWLDSAGHVSRSDVIESSGKRQRDAAFGVAVQKVQVSQAPPDFLPQPLRLEFQAR